VGALLQIADHPSGKTYLPAYDGNGNIAALLNASTGALAAAYEYSPFGEPLRAQTLDSTVADNPFRFSTKYTDVETGLVYYGHRYYDPKNGRFINRDPIEESGGINLYGFCRNDGINRWDFLGLEPTHHGDTADIFQEEVPDANGVTYTIWYCNGGYSWSIQSEYYVPNGNTNPPVTTDPNATDSGAGALGGPNDDLSGFTTTFSSSPGSLVGSDLSLLAISPNPQTTSTPDPTGLTLLNSGVGPVTITSIEPTVTNFGATLDTGSTTSLWVGAAGPISPVDTTAVANPAATSSVSMAGAGDVTSALGTTGTVTYSTLSAGGQAVLVVPNPSGAAAGTNVSATAGVILNGTLMDTRVQLTVSVAVLAGVGAAAYGSGTLSSGQSTTAPSTGISPSGGFRVELGAGTGRIANVSIDWTPGDSSTFSPPTTRVRFNGSNIGAIAAYAAVGVVANLNLTSPTLGELLRRLGELPDPPF